MNVFIYEDRFGSLPIARMASAWWNMKWRPTISELLARPLGCLSLALSSSSAAELMAPQQTAMMSPENVVFFPEPSSSASTASTAVPVAFVSRRVTLACVIRVTFGRCMIWRMQLISASDFACTRHG